MVTPHVFKTDSTEGDTQIQTEKISDLTDEQYTVIHEGMRLGATVGTGKIFNSLPFAVASKTGTAQVGANGAFVNGWLNTFFPYENPHYALVVMLERGSQNIGTAQRIAYDFLDWVRINAPEYIK